MRKYIIVFAISLFLLFGKVNALTKAPVDVTTMSISELLEALDKGYLTSETLVNIYLERIEAYDDMFNSINQLNEHALEQARELDLERQSGNIKGKLHGIPLLVKCNIDVYGMPTTAGTKSLIDNYPLDDSYVVEKLIDEGAIILGSTNMSELAFSAANSYSSYGYVRNVFNTSYTPYGSSGGSAVAVKAAFAAASLGTDTNSSVRLPASGAGLVGMRPTLGLVSRTGVIPYDIERDTVGVLSRNVSDNALILGIISGDDGVDEITKGVSTKNYDLSNTSLKGVNIGVVMQYVKGSESGSGITGLTDSDIYALLEKSIQELENAGANIIYLSDFVKNSNISIARTTYAGRTMCDNFNKYILGTTGKIRSFEQLASSSGHVQVLSGYLESCGTYTSGKSTRDAKKKIYRDYVSNYFDEYDLDVLLYPSLKNKVFKYNKTGNISPGSSLGSVIGYPSITVPMGYVGDFSYGIEFLSKDFKEDVLYNVAFEFEKVNGNKVETSKLTPSLYEIPTTVLKLKELYEAALLSNSDIGIVNEWMNETKSFFLNYNDIDNVEEKANELILKYDSFDVDRLIAIDSFEKDDVVEFIVVLGLFCLLIILFRRIFRFFK
ncbi:MAG: amidase [Candidatus Coprovivens sp.]